MLSGIVLIAAVRVAAPRTTAPPLYDSFGRPESYVYLHPGPGQRGNPDRAALRQPITPGVDPGPITLATDENPPQAQLIIAAASLDIPTGAHAITTTITPVDTPALAPPNGIIAGNTYRFAVTTDTGSAVQLLPGHPATLVLRGPAGSDSGTIDVVTDLRWTPLSTTPVAAPGTFAANTQTLGDSALAVPTGPELTGRFDWLPWAVGATTVVIATATAAIATITLRLRRRRRP